MLNEIQLVFTMVVLYYLSLVTMYGSDIGDHDRINKRYRRQGWSCFRANVMYAWCLLTIALVMRAIAIILFFMVVNVHRQEQVAGFVLLVAAEIFVNMYYSFFWKTGNSPGLATVALLAAVALIITSIALFWSNIDYVSGNNAYSYTGLGLLLAVVLILFYYCFVGCIVTRYPEESVITDELRPINDTKARRSEKQRYMQA